MMSEGRILERCPLDHHMSAGLRVNRNDPKIICLDCGLTLAAPDWVTLYERWHSRRASVAAVEGDALTTLIKEAANAAMKRLDRAEEVRTGCLDLRGGKQREGFQIWLQDAMRGVAIAAASSPAPAEPKICVKCGHRATIDGVCQVGTGAPHPVTGYKAICGCKCEFAAPVAATADNEGEKRDGSMSEAQLQRAALIAESREIDLETAQELVYLRDRVDATYWNRYLDGLREAERLSCLTGAIRERITLAEAEAGK